MSYIVFEYIVRDYSGLCGEKCKINFIGFVRIGLDFYFAAIVEFVGERVRPHFAFRHVFIRRYVLTAGYFYFFDFLAFWRL